MFHTECRQRRKRMNGEGDFEDILRMFTAEASQMRLPVVAGEVIRGEKKEFY